jgi:nucleoside-diphosphate-sugar epimerase
VAALSHSEGARSELVEQGIVVVSADLDDGTGVPELHLSNVGVYYFCPPTSRASDDQRIGVFLASIVDGEEPAHIVLVSTTGVYGDCAGNWIDEHASPNPQVARSRCRLDVEQQLQGWCESKDIQLIILRVPGIYGQGRLPVERIRKQVPVLSEAESPWSNRIHIDDLVQACMKAADYEGDMRVFNVSDGTPSTMTDYFNRVADAVGLKRPPEISRRQAEAELSAGMLSYLNESKRISNQRMVDTLGVELRYPSLMAGLAASI